MAEMVSKDVLEVAAVPGIVVVESSEVKEE